MSDAEAIAGRFAPSVISLAPFGGGHINETFLAETADGDMILQRVNRAVVADAESVMANIISVRQHLRGAMVPEPIPARDGQWLVRAAGDTWRAWRRVPGAAPAGTPTPAKVRTAGRLLGQFHAALADLAPPRLAETLPGFHDPARRRVALRRAVEADVAGRVATAEGEIAAAFAAAPLIDLAAAITVEVPMRIAHNDAKLDNVLFRDGEAVCLVDLDTLMPGAWLWDIGDLLRTASTTTAEDDPGPARPAVDPELYGAIIDGYQDGVGGVATAAEIDALAVAGAIVTYEQALRFLTDWIEGDVYYRTSRPGQNLDRARVQLGLLGSMPGTVTAP